MKSELETRATQTDTGWQDHDGFIGPFRPGNGPRSDPRGDFPTGPDVGESMPDLRCHTADGFGILNTLIAAELTLPIAESPPPALWGKKGAAIEPNARAHFQRMSERRVRSD